MGGITLFTKRTKHQNRPAANKHEVTWAGNKSGPKSVFIAGEKNTQLNDPTMHAGYTKASSTTRSSKTIAPTFGRKLLHVPARSASPTKRRRGHRRRRLEVSRLRLWQRKILKVQLWSMNGSSGSEVVMALDMMR